MRKTKIICTLGPASSDEKTIREMILAGMDVARFNFSHGTHEEHLARYQMVDKIRRELSLPIGTLLDTKGPEVRLGTFKEHKVTLLPGATFTLTAQKVEGDVSRASISYPNLYQDIQVGSKISIDDGLIELKVLEIAGKDIVCTVINGGEVSDRKGINVPGVHLSMPYISQQDYDDIVFGIETGFDFIAASFVSTAEDIFEIRKVLTEHNCHSIKIIAKIENAEGVNNIDEILRAADGIMVARGDMGVEIPLEDVPIHQKVLIKKAYGAGKHVITATQMLESMVKNPRPTRAEANDIANAIYDGTSGIMLSGESAAGKYPVESVRTMARIAERIERDIDYRRQFAQGEHYSERDVTNAISHATCTTAYDLGASAIISITQSGHTARMCSRFRPGVPIIACTPSESIFHQLSMSWGVHPIIMELKENTDELFSCAIECAKEHGYVKNGDLVVITAGVPLGVPGTTNLLKVSVVGDVLVSGQGLNQLTTVGNLCVAKNEQEALLNFKQNDILVIAETSNEILGLLKQSSGIITEAGGAGSHAAIVGLTLDIPVIVGAKNATSILKSGTSVVIDAGKGLVCNAATFQNH